MADINNKDLKNSANHDCDCKEKDCHKEFITTSEGQGNKEEQKRLHELKHLKD